MKKLSSTITRVASITGLFLGAFALSVLADSSSWTPATCSAPGCNTDAPVNVGANAQFKTGSLAVSKASAPTSGYDFEVEGNALLSGLNITGKTVTNTLQVTNGAQAGYVLASDASGNATWQSSGTYHYLSAQPLVSNTLGLNGNWTPISYPSDIPTTAKSIIIRSVISPIDGGGGVIVEVGGIPEVSVLTCREFGVGMLVIPYSTERVVKAYTANHNDNVLYSMLNACCDYVGGKSSNGGTYAGRLSIIGYID